MHATVAARTAAGGYADIGANAARMGSLHWEVYRAIPKNARIYDRLFAVYKTLYDYLRRGQNDVMKRLRTMRREALAAK